MKKEYKNNIPEELKLFDQWVGWVEKEGETGKARKIPINPNKKKSTPANVSDPATWGSYYKAMKAYERLGLDGIGFVFSVNDPFAGIDIDHCYNSKTKTFAARAIIIVSDIDSYSEFSPSGEGLHIIVKAKLYSGNRKGEWLEIYDRKRFFTVTGRHLETSPTEINNRDDEIQDLIETHFPAQKTDYSEPSILKSTDLSDDEIISRAKKAENGEKFWSLWNGDKRGYKSHSEADLALCKKLCSFVGRNPNRIDRLFRKSKLFREKWDKRHKSDGATYGQMTIEKAVETTNNNYEHDYEFNTLMDIAGQAELFHSPLKVSYATIPVGDHSETWPIKSPQFTNHLRYLFFKAKSKPPRPININSTIDHLDAKAQFEGPEKQIYTRVAEQNGEIFLDLANAEREVVRINGDGWIITNKYPVKFQRLKGMAPLPRPEPNGKIRKLIKILNITDPHRWILLVSWLIGAFSPTGPYPILLLLGPQGSLKSTHGRILRALIDPSVALLRTLPTSERDLMITANNSLVLAYDNLSNLKPWLSDAFCKLSTGGGFATRKNYTDEEEMIFDSKRPIILNGINVLAYNHDLVDRCIIINLPEIKKKKRRPEAEVMKDFEKAQPSILGGLCTAISTAIKNLPNTSLASYPRMADFAKWVTAAEPALPWDKGEFMKSYNLNRTDAIQRSLETDPVAEAVIEMMKHGKSWSGTASELLKKLENSGFVSLNVVQSKIWPKASHVLSGKLKRASTFLSEIGIEVIFHPRESKKRGITIRRIE